MILELSDQSSLLDSGAQEPYEGGGVDGVAYVISGRNEVLHEEGHGVVNVVRHHSNCFFDVCRRSHRQALRPDGFAIRPPQDRIGEGVIEDGFLFSAPRAPQFVNGGGLNFIDPSPGLNNWNGLNTGPYNGTYYAQPYTGSEPVLTQTDDLPFALDSFDYAPLSATYNGTNTILVTG